MSSSILPKWDTAKQTATTTLQSDIDDRTGKYMLAIDNYADEHGPQATIALLEGQTRLVTDPTLRTNFEAYLSGQQPAQPTVPVLGTAPGTGAQPTSADAARVAQLEQAIEQFVLNSGGQVKFNSQVRGQIDAATSLDTAKVALAQSAPGTAVADFKQNTLKPAIEALENALAKVNSGIGGVQKFSKDDWNEVDTTKTALVALKA